MFGGRKSMFGSEGSADIVVDLNLTPLMDVMSNILFFLLASFGAAIVSFLNASVPVQSDTPPAEMQKNMVVITIQMTTSEYKIAASNDWLPAEDLEKLKRTLPKVGGNYDVRGLGEYLYKVKEQYPASESMMLVPDVAVSYEHIVATMEAAREHRIDAKRKVRLFPKAVISGVITAD
jgi:biopolymer transport protein ExbD